jgi:uncharacterized surface protein with fasciclin (FAS1) repeats
MNSSNFRFSARRYVFLALLGAFFLFTTCQKDVISGGNTIYEVINGDPQFRMLSAAIRYVGLTGTLKAGNLTFFAPTDSAFHAAGFKDTAAILSNSVDSIATLLRYHILGTKIATELFPRTKIDTPLILRVLSDTSKLANLDTTQSSILVINSTLYISNPGQDIYLNGARIVSANIDAQNGVVHKIDRFLSPATANLSKTIAKNPQLTIFSAALKKVGGNLAGRLAGSGPLTVFAPSDQAFTNAGITLANLDAVPKDSLAKQLSYHIIKARRFSNHFINGKVFKTLQGKTITMQVNGKNISIKDAVGSTPSPILKPDFVATNGLVQVIGTFLKYQ